MLHSLRSRLSSCSIAETGRCRSSRLRCISLHIGSLPLRRTSFQKTSQSSSGQLQRTGVCKAYQGPGASLQETAKHDQLIDLLMEAQNPQELAQRVADNILSFHQGFWIRIAARSDSAETPEQKEKFKALASTVMWLVDAAVKESTSKTEAQLSESGKVLQEILTAAADERGEWHLPLAPEQLAALRQAMDDRAQYMNDALLSNALKWMEKASKDNLDGVVILLQKVIQIYAARKLTVGQYEGVDSVLNKIINADEEEWSQLIESHANDGVSEPAMMAAIQKRMEGVVIGSDAGSYTQRVLAEVLKEFEERTRNVYQKLAAKE